MDQQDKRPIREEVEEKVGSPPKGGADNRTNPRKDLIASAAIAAFALIVMFLALRMPNPGTPFTAPGLLPFFTGLALLIMAVGLGIRSVSAGGVKGLLQGRGKALQGYFSDVENLRALLLIGIIVLYVILVKLIAFDLRLPTPIFVFQFSSYELISIITLTLILKIFWRATWLRCFLVSAFWIVALASVFRYGFHILLPGLG